MLTLLDKPKLSAEGADFLASVELNQDDMQAVQTALMMLQMQAMQTMQQVPMPAPEQAPAAAPAGAPAQEGK